MKGYVARTREEYAQRLQEIFQLGYEKQLRLRKNARASVLAKFSEPAFHQAFLHTSGLIELLESFGATS